MKTKPSFELEEKFGGCVVGIDEAGRGALAGPIVVAAAIINRNLDVSDINDSKKLSESKRERLFEYLIKILYYKVEIIDVDVIEERNVLYATLFGMNSVIKKIDIEYDCVLIDGNFSPDAQNKKLRPIVKGDSKSLSIAAASIIAKVIRDRIMRSLSQEYTYYSWEKNKGYGTKMHIESIQQHGVSQHHRRTFLKNIQLC